MSNVEMEELNTSDNIPIIQITENGIEGFEILCRLCANKSDNLIPIYSEEGMTNDLSTKMNLYLPIKVAETDQLPLQCCFQCATTVLNWHELVVASVEADKRLRELHEEAEKHLQEQELSVKMIPGNEERTEIKQDDESDDGRYMADDLKIEELEDPVIENGLEIKIKNESNQFGAKNQAKPQRKVVKSIGKKYKCKTCLKVFSRTTLARHQKRCNIERPKKIKLPHSCDICEIRFSKKSEMYSHRNLEHKDAPAIPNKKNFPCKICKIDFEKKFDFLQHWGNEHRDQKPLNRVSAIAFENKIVINSAEKNPHQCNICSASYKRERDLLRHYMVHENNVVDPFEGNLFSNDQSSSDSESNVFDLDLFQNQRKVLKLFDNCHHFGNDGNIFYECKSCLQKFGTALEFIEDQISHSSESSVKIDLEDPDLIRALEILDDSKIIKENQTVTHKCQTCQTEVLTEADFIEHYKTHSNEVKRSENKNQKDILKILNDSKSVDDNGKVAYKCNICLKEFLIKDWFIRHYKLHSGGVPINNFAKSETQSFPCDICSKVFTRKADMLRHRERFHKMAPPYINKQKANRSTIWKRCEIEVDGKKLWKCDLCQKILNNKYRFSRHYELHTKSADELKKYICEICAKTFRLRNSLRRHIQEIHENIKNHFCEICGNGFKNKQVLKEHINTHTDYRPFKCEICSKTFRQKASLYIHKVFHSNEPKFSCNLCDYKCHRASQLKIHSLNHTGERPHVCSVCGTTFRLQYLLKNHMYIHSNVTFPCEICGENFRQPRYLQRHIRTKHRGLEIKKKDTDSQREVDFNKTEGSVKAHIGPESS